MKNKKKKVTAVISVVIILVVAWIAFCGYEWGWGPFLKLHNHKIAALP